MCKGPAVGAGETELGHALLLLGNRGTERGGDQETKAMQLAEVDLGACGEGTRGWDLGRLRVSAPWPEPSRLRLEERQPPLPKLFSLLLAAAVLSPRLITNGVFHPHLIMQQMPVGPPPSGLTCWLGIMGPSDAP